MKKQNLALLILSSAFLLCSCQPSGPDASSNSGSDSSQKQTITLNKTSFSLAIGQTFQLVASSDGVSYSSSDPNVASVDSSGLVKAISLGSAIITASLGEEKALAKVTVTDEALSTLSIAFPSSSLALYEEESISLSPIVKYGDMVIEDASIEYGSEDASVVAYADGRVSAVKKGSAYIYAKVTYEGMSDVAYINVEVLSVTTRITPNFRERNVVVGSEGLTLSFTLIKGNEEIEAASPFVYSLSDDSLAEIDGNVLKGKKKGKVDLTVSTVYDDETIETSLSIVVNEKLNIEFYDETSLLKSYEILDGETIILDFDEPERNGYLFRNFIDENGKVFSEETVFEESASFQATWLANAGKMDGAIGTVVKAMNVDSGIVCPDSTNIIEEDEGVQLHLQKEGVTSFDITLPAFDYNSAGRVDFYIENNYGSDPWGTIKAGDGSFAYSSIKNKVADAYVVSDGTKASFYVNSQYLITYDEDVSSGKKGLSFVFERQSFNKYQELTIGDFKQYAYDYRAAIDELVSSLPDDVSSLSDEEAMAKMKEHAAITSYFTAYEAANYEEPAKISALRSSLSGKSTPLFALPPAYNWYTVNAMGVYTDGKGFNETPAEGYMGINFQSGGKSDGVTQYVQFPLINYSAYASVAFKISHNYSGASVKVGENTLVASTVADNKLDVAISTSSGKTTISCGSASFELSEAVANGKEPLRFDITRERDLSATSYDSFTFSVFNGTF